MWTGKTQPDGPRRGQEDPAPDGVVVRILELHGAGTVRPRQRVSGVITNTTHHQRSTQSRIERQYPGQQPNTNFTDRAAIKSIGRMYVTPHRALAVVS